MSLLIKALETAEKAQAQNAKTEQTQAEIAAAKQSTAEPDARAVKQTIKQARFESSTDLELSLSPTGSAIAEPSPEKASLISSAPIKTASQTATQAPVANASSKSATNVFTAKGVEAKTGNKRLAIIAGAGLLSLLAMGAYFYQFIDNTPVIAASPRPIALQPEMPQATPQVVQQSAQLAESTALPAASASLAEASMPHAFEPNEPTQLAEKLVKKLPKKPAMVEDEEFSLVDNASAENTTESSEPVVMAKASKKGGKSKTLQMGESIASSSASINVTKTKPAAGVNPTLMSAYDAYNAGKDNEALKLYKQVLQQDVRNVDALLGLGAIASRQGRVADANGWYGKVLELDPRNNIAQAALLDNAPQGNELNSESRLKNMLAKQPDDANLHVALGNLYAEQNQWPAAQQAYFDAYRLRANADNAFNLAVSLDQMGKSKLALPYYQRALELAQTSANGIDKAALEARIAAIQ